MLLVNIGESQGESPLGVDRSVSVADAGAEALSSKSSWGDTVKGSEVCPEAPNVSKLEESKGKSWY